MRLSTRLTVVLLAVTTVVALLVGWYAVATSARADYAALDGVLDTVVASGQANPLTALTSALSVVQQNNDDVTLDVVSATGKVTQIATSTVPLTRSPTRADATAALSAVRTSPDLAGFRYRAVAIGGGDILVAAVSTHGVAERSRRLVERTILAGLLAAVVVAVASRLVIRRDLRTVDRLVDYAGGVAGGDLERTPPPADGSTDVRALRTSLVDMVTSLHRTIEAEQRVALVTQRFIGDASHELRTPLTVVKGYAELLAGGAVDEAQQARALERMRRELDRMDALVGDLLFLAEVNERPDPPDEVIDLSGVVDRAASDFALDHPGRHLDVDAAPGVLVRARPGYLERLLANALGNVARHTPEVVPVRVTLAREADAVTLLVEDGGPGLPPEAYGLAPERFRRFDEGRARASGGTGLGMSIMADVASALGGSLTTQRSDLGGLALSVRLPSASAPPT